ncbi:MAG TPA: YfhO family protein [Thermoanaerobaculia bacterium]|nr:YfhO family protein [Thermoanaerobaculia bacterium]
MLHNATWTTRWLRWGCVFAAFAFVVVLALGMHRGLLLSSDVKSRCWPWKPFLTAVHLHTPILTDPVWQFVPWLRFAHEEVWAGRLPIWNPHQDGGEPLLGNSQSALGSPLVWPALLLGVERGWNLSLLLRILLAAAAAFFWLRDLGRSRLAASLGAVGFSLSGAFVAWLQHPHTLVAAAVPLLLLFARRAARSGSRASVAAVAGATFLVLSGGHPESQLMGAILTAAIVTREAIVGRNLRALLAPVLGAVLGVGLAAPLLLPFVEYYRLSAARLGRGRLPSTLPPHDLIRFLLPSASGSHPIEAAASVSIVLLLLVPIGLVLSRDGETRFWAVAAAAMLVVIYENPVSRALANSTAVLWTRFLLFVPLAFGAIASAGLDALSNRIAARETPRGAVRLAAILIVLASAELALHARGVHAVTPVATLAPTTPILEKLRADRDVFRILPLHTFLPPNSATDYALDDVRGYDALGPEGWIEARSAMGRFGQTRTMSDGLEPWDLKPGGQALDSWNVRYLLLDPRFPFSAAELNERLGLDLEEIYRGPDGRILRNRRSKPRARLSVAGSIVLRQRLPTRWDFEISPASAGEFLLANPYFPGWRVSVDGNPVHLDLPAGAPIAFPVPAGQHRVRIDYRPQSLDWGMAAMFCSLAALLALLRRPHRSAEALGSGSASASNPISKD